MQKFFRQSLFDFIYTIRVFIFSVIDRMQNRKFHCCRCDACSTSPITGPRYKCQLCEDFDMCDSCFHSVKGHRHPFIRFTEPGEWNTTSLNSCVLHTFSIWLCYLPNHSLWLAYKMEVSTPQTGDIPLLYIVLCNPNRTEKKTLNYCINNRIKTLLSQVPMIWKVDVP